MKLLIFFISILPFFASLFILSDFISKPNQLPLTVESKYFQNNGYFVKFSECGSYQFSVQEINIIRYNDRAFAYVGIFSGEILSIIFPDKNIKINLTSQSKKMFGMVLFICIMSIMGCIITYKNIKIGKMEIFVWVLYGTAMFLGFIIAIRLIAAELGYIDKF